MDKERIDADWHLVLKRASAVVQIANEISSRYRAVLRFDRAALIRLYDPTRDFRAVARELGVSSGAINYALWRLVKIAVDLERRHTLNSASDGKRWVVIVPVEHQAEAAYVQHLLMQHELRGVVERLEECEYSRDESDE